MECKDLDLYILFDKEASPEDKAEILAHLSNCTSCQNDYKELEAIINEVNTLEVTLPEEANDLYFENLEKRIMTEVTDFCRHVQDSLVDYCESSLSDNERELITSHLGTCSKCYREFAITSQLINKNEKCTVFPEEYFETLPEKLSDKIFGHIKDLCEMSQDMIANEITEDEIPTTIKRHLDSCPRCIEAKAEIKKIVEAVHELSVPLPSEKYFDGLLARIDNAIEVMPSPRLAEKEHNGLISGFFSTLSVVKSFVFQPYVAIATTATLVALIIGGRMLFNDGFVFDRQSNLSGILNSASNDADAEIRKETEPYIDTDLNQQTANMFKYFHRNNTEDKDTAYYLTDPSFDEKMYIKKRGTAENNPIEENLKHKNRDKRFK